MKLKVLVSDGDQKHTLGIIRSLGERNISVGVLTRQSMCLCSFSKFCFKEHIVDLNKDNFVEELYNVYSKFNYDVFLPVGSISNYYIFKNKAEIINKGINISFPSSKSFEIAFSKELTTKHASTINIKTPKTWFIESLNELENFSYDFNNKLVIKAKYEMGVNVVIYVNDIYELKSAYLKVCEKYSWKKPEQLPLIQEYIDGKGMGFFGYYKNGKLLAHFQHERLREYPITGGMSVCAISSRNLEIYNLGKKLLDSLNWNGVAMVEFKMNKNNVPYLLEINPKFWGSIELAIECGAEFPYYYALSSINQQNQINFVDFQNKKFHWPLHGDIQTCFSSLPRFVQFIKDLFSFKTASNIKFKTDFSGTIGIFINLTQKLFKFR